MTESGSMDAADARDARETWNKKNIVERFVSEALDRGLLDVVAEGDWLAFRLKHRGTHTGEFLGLVFNRVENGVVVENWGLHDKETLWKQLMNP